MDDLKSHLSGLLEKDLWTDEEKEWMLSYLESSDTRELHELMEKQFNEPKPQPVHPDLSHQMLQEIYVRLGIEKKEKKEKKASVIRIWPWRVAIAASLLLLVGLGWRFLVSKKETPVVLNPGITTDSVLAVIRNEMNTTGQEKRIQLPDGSLIVLANNSGVTYRDPFADKRDISLTGKAYFKVAADKSKPFIVTSGEISTTALGTEFTVTAYRRNNEIIVRLYEGKVVVKAMEKDNRKMKNDVYLLPGQEFVYGEKSFVRSFKESKAAPGKIIRDESGRDNPAIPENAEPYFMFNNQPLDGVLDDLAGLYDTKIIYNKKDVQNIYWTGKYQKSDSLEIILKRIGTLHNLTVTRKDNAFIISK